MDKTLTENNAYTCLECQNENTIEGKELNDIVECGFCGIEYEVTAITDGEFEIRMLEEEK